ncbi:hypothetical protein FQA39_LY18978 [Lamprigera yunnana]|nr:hypothetical protein FQA39_LY18978 [Lamprigera yunnana]
MPRSHWKTLVSVQGTNEGNTNQLSTRKQLVLNEVSSTKRWLTFYDNYGRPLPAVGDLISGSDWFPIEINIAEVIGNIANGITTIPTAVTNGFSNVIGFVLKLPIVNRFISGETPRPYVVFIPRSAFAIQDERANLNTYNGKFHMFSQYP